VDLSNSFVFYNIYRRDAIINRRFFLEAYLLLNIAKELNIYDYDSIMEILIIIKLLLFLPAAFYLIVHIGLLTGLRRCRQTKSQEQPFVTVLVAARNEEKNILQMLECLSKQTYPSYEIIIINDRSTDRTDALITEFQKEHPRIKRIDITTMPSDMPAKKNALQAGIESSTGEILCFTDADCFPPSEWVEELVRQFEPEVGLVAGYSPYQVPPRRNSMNKFWNTVFYLFISYEEFRAAIWSAGSIGWNLGWLCTGRNLAYRRKVFEEVQGYETIKHSISGDDDLFLQLVRRQTHWKIRYLLAKGSFVPTQPPLDFRSFIEQRKRHFSASKVFTIPMMIFFFIYHASNFILLFSPLFIVLNTTFISVVVTGLCTKLVGDTILILSSIRFFDCSVYRQSYLLMEIFYVLYNTFIGPLGLLKRFEWKQNSTP
jgi:cellulose synthase/poly-beta-1,6-N-acetylglucosamine synthase-like glycosyltransferase